MKISDYHIGFVGFGHIAQALFQAIDHSRLIPRSQIAFTRKDPSKSRMTQEHHHITGTSLSSLCHKSDLLFLCIPPKEATHLLPLLKNHKNSHTKIVSLMAGISLATLENYLDPSTEILRAMPNLGLSVGEGMTLLSANEAASSELHSAAHLLFSAAGKVLPIPESLMNLGTALAGSGPALAIYFIDAMARFGVQEGFSQSDSIEMAAQVFRGAAALIVKHPSDDLLQQIATPGGTTEAGLNSLRRTPSALHLQEALHAAAQKARSLGTGQE